MKKILIFLIITFSFSDVSNTIFKIKQIQNSKKLFLKYPSYNIFVKQKINKDDNNVQVIMKSSNLPQKMKIYAIFNNKVNINGKWKNIGDYVNDYKIIKIYSNYVVLRKNNKIKILKFLSNIIKVSK